MNLNLNEPEVLDPTNTEDNATALEEAATKIAALTQERDDALAINAKLVAEIERLTGEHKTAQKETPKVDAGEYSFENNGIKYGFNYSRTIFKKQVITPVEVCASPELQDKLIAMKSGMIKVIS